MIRVGSDFSGVGAFNQALIRLGIPYKEVFACDMDKFARQTFVLNYGEPEYYPANVYDREIPEESLDIFMTSPPCQAFSLAGKRKGEEDKRGVLFYNSHEFIQKNKPRYFIFENVKGLLSDDSGKTFQRWIDFLGGKTVNGNPVIFPHEESVPYHVYYQVLNAKHYGIPQNRERIFIIGIRDDADNNFSFPKPFPLEKRLKDVLEHEVDEKYFLSDKMIEGFVSKVKRTDWTFEPLTSDNESSKCVTAHYAKMGITDNYLDVSKVGFINQDTQASQVYSENGIVPNLCAGTHGYASGYVETKAGRIIGRNPDNPKSRVAGLPTEQMFEENEDSTITNTLTTVQKDNVVVEFNLPGKHEQNSRVYSSEGISPTLTTMQGGGQEPKISLSAEVYQLNPSLESGGKQPYQHNRVYDDRGVMTTLDTDSGRKPVFTQKRIRRLTPTECFRLMDFNPEMIEKTINSGIISDSQLYKQAGNSICVGVLASITEKLNLSN